MGVLNVWALKLGKYLTIQPQEFHSNQLTDINEGNITIKDNLIVFWGVHDSIVSESYDYAYQ